MINNTSTILPILALCYIYTYTMTNTNNSNNNDNNWYYTSPTASTERR